MSKEVEKKQENPEIPDESGDIIPKEPEPKKESRFKPMIERGKALVKRCAKPFAVGAAVGGAIVMFISGMKGDSSEVEDDNDDVYYLDGDDPEVETEDEGPTE